MKCRMFQWSARLQSDDLTLGPSLLCSRLTVNSVRIMLSCYLGRFCSTRQLRQSIVPQTLQPQHGLFSVGADGVVRHSRR